MCVGFVCVCVCVCVFAVVHLAFRILHFGFLQHLHICVFPLGALGSLDGIL